MATDPVTENRGHGHLTALSGGGPVSGVARPGRGACIMNAGRAAPDTGLPPSWPAAAATMQRDLLCAANDLSRLQSLLADACETLIQRFRGAADNIEGLLKATDPPPSQPERLHDAMAQLGGALTALQFQDMASQLIAHTDARLRRCAAQLGSQAAHPQTTTAARPNPVAQSEMDAGSVELF